MPNLMPDWMDWIRPAGRLLWGLFLTGVAFSFITALLLPPLVKRPVPTRKAVAGFPVILVVFLLLAKFVDSLQTVWIWLGLLSLIGYGLSLVVSREPREPKKQTTWVEAFLGATGTMAVMWIVYGVVPHEWLTFANSYLEWGDSSKFVWKSGDHLVFGLNVPFDLNLPAVRDIVVTVIYVVFLGANIFLFSKWQQRFAVKPVKAAGTAPARRSRFGRPLRPVAAPEPVAVGSEA